MDGNMLSNQDAAQHVSDWTQKQVNASAKYEAQD